MDDILDMLGQSKWRSTLDLVSGYWQIPVHEDDIEKTAFVMCHGTFEFMVMPFGLTNALASFQRDMDVVLSGLNWVSTLMYIDNIIVFSQSFKEHLQHLQEVLLRLQEANMFMKPSKSVTSAARSCLSSGISSAGREFQLIRRRCVQCRRWQHW